MKRKKIESYFGLARRAGKILSGYRTCMNSIGRGKIKLIILAEDTSQNTKDKFQSLCERYGIAFRIYGRSEDLSVMSGMPERGVFGITDRNFAEAMIKEIENEQIVLR